MTRAGYAVARMELTLQGRRALVCGSTQGIGKACAIELARLGAACTLLARDAGALEAVGLELPAAHGQKHDWLVADFANHEAVRAAAMDGLARHRAGFHILINNTGGPPGGRAIDAAPEEFSAAFATHILSGQVLVQALVPGMRSARYGRIINIVSTSVKAPIPGLGVSNTIRAAVANWAKTLSIELGPDGITVNNVLPGYTETARLRSLIGKRARAASATEDAVSEEFRRSIPLGRFADPGEVAAAVAFLASPAASYISGINLPVDGARTPSL